MEEVGKRLAILTSRSLSEMRHLLHESHPINQKIEKIYHQENSEYLKPDPRVFNQVIDYFDVLPSECVYIGDTVSDAAAAKGAGTHFIAVLESGLKRKKDFDGQNVDFFADKFPDILKYVLASPK